MLGVLVPGHPTSGVHQCLTNFGEDVLDQTTFTADHDSFAQIRTDVEGQALVGRVEGRVGRRVGVTVIVERRVVPSTWRGPMTVSSSVLLRRSVVVRMGELGRQEFGAVVVGHGRDVIAGRTASWRTAVGRAAVGRVASFSLQLF